MADVKVANSSSSLSNAILILSTLAQTITGLKLFDRGTDAPFAVNSGAAMVSNLDGEKLNGQPASFYQDASNMNAGTLAAARFPSTLPPVSGASLTNLNASNLVNGEIGGTVLAALATHFQNMFMPVGFIYESTVSTYPGTLLGFGTWAAYGAGKFLVAINNPTDAEFATGGQTGGEKSHVLTISEMPAHDHPGSTVGVTLNDDTPNGGSGVAVNAGGSAAVTVASQGGGAAHYILPPYVVIYRWVRTG